MRLPNKERASQGDALSDRQIKEINKGDLPAGDMPFWPVLLLRHGLSYRLFHGLGRHLVRDSGRRLFRGSGDRPGRDPGGRPSGRRHDLPYGHDHGLVPDAPPWKLLHRDRPRAHVLGHDRVRVLCLDGTCRYDRPLSFWRGHPHHDAGPVNGHRWCRRHGALRHSSRQVDWVGYRRSIHPPGA